MSKSGDSGSGGKRFGTADYFKITILVFAISALWQSLHSIILPLRVLDFVAESQKNTYLGLLTFSGLILAMAIQPIVSAISDRSGFRWGRRRPYILLGVMLATLFLPGIGLAGSYAVLFISYCLLQASSNTAQGPLQAFIPEMVPQGKRGLASGVKGLLEVLGGVALIYPVAIFMDNYSAGQGSQWLWLALVTLGVILLALMVATVLSVKERPAIAAPRLPILSTIYKPFKIDLRANRNFIWFLASRLLIFMAFATIQQFALYFLRDVIGVADPAAATATFTIVAVVGMLATVYPAGRLSDRIGRKPIAISAALLGAVGILVIILSQSYSSTLIAAGILGVAIGAFSSTNWAMAVDLVAKGEEARYLALANVATAGGAALARLIGPVIDYFENQSAGLGYQVMLVVSLVYLVIGALLLLKIKAPLSRGGPAPPPSP
ncbi:MAG: MFS transporter [Dehalococcoidales bacterium]